MKQDDTCKALSKGMFSQIKGQVQSIFNICEVTTSIILLNQLKNIQWFFITWKAKYWHSRPSTVWKLAFQLYFQLSSKPVVLKLQGT